MELGSPVLSDAELERLRGSTDPAFKAVWLPTLFYFCALLFGYAWAQRAFPFPLLPRLPWLRAGHVLVLLLGAREVTYGAVVVHPTILLPEHGDALSVPLFEVE